MNVKLAGVTLSAVLLLGLPRLEAATVVAGEMTECRDWVAAKFEGRQPPMRTDPALVVVANHGPVQKNARGGKPMRLAGRDHTRGLYCHTYGLPITLPASRSSGLLTYRRSD